jgi:DNA-binding response OmpR family regulator
MLKPLPKATILVIEDDPAMLRGLLDVLVFNGYAPTGVDDGAEGLRLALAQNFDLIILDVMLPSLEGLPLCQQVRANKPGQAILMLTAKGAEDDVIAGLRAGADDYVSKPFSLRELLARIEAVLRRSGANTGDDVFQAQGLTFCGKTLTASRGQQSVELTRREFDIVRHLFRHQDRIVSKAELLRDVWKYADPDIETRTVDIHILKLRKKLAALRPDAALIQTVRGEGYRLE